MVEGNPGSNKAADEVGEARLASTLAWRQTDCKPEKKEGGAESK